MESLYLVGFAVVAVIAFIFVVILFNFFGLWLRARIANAPVSIGKMVGMRLRRVPVGMIVDNRITAVKAGIEIPSDPLEAHYLAGGDVGQVILALIAADKAGIALDFNRACAIDLATKGTGKTVLEAVRTSINPKVIDVPNPSMGRTTIDGVAKDGIGEAKAEVRRAAAVAVEQEMRAKTQEMRAKVVEAESLVPQAMADAFRSGNLGIMDYVRMKNLQADTSMRESIAGTDKPPAAS